MKQPYQYQLIEKAIALLQQQYLQQPSLNDIAVQLHVSPQHFQKMFVEWAGVTPKKFIQYLTVAHAKKILGNYTSKAPSLFEVAAATGLSGTGRLHDLFVTIEGMTPGEFKNTAAPLSIFYSFATSPFGDVIIASTHKGICHVAFFEEGKQTAAIAHLQQLYIGALLQYLVQPMHTIVVSILNNIFTTTDKITLHVKGTSFQLKVWEALLKIPTAAATTYGTLAKNIAHPKASRAVGTAVGANPVAFIIPCHRVIQASGIIGEYRWGTLRKKAIIGWEAAQANANE
ncbi:methylated-DNA--[protein]-cysteine S-methyltransferase [Ferruginibacter yonginensis]|uniref:Methylated-DNA--[protein]-cysteine S-methyltransferase n=1 Tax=Ferruginibacter yonginensis TaxID=1310416 RepID=A0ABV8QXI8_9BACT